MGVFDFLKKRKSELSREQKKWNKMWDLWAENRADTPYAEVMTYQSEVNNGGHDQYFLTNRNRPTRARDTISMTDIPLPPLSRRQPHRAARTALSSAPAPRAECRRAHFGHSAP